MGVSFCLDYGKKITKTPKKITKTYMDAPGMSTYYLSLRADFQHEYVLNLLLPLVCCAEGSLKMA
jgi:hypothetical protein